MGSLFSATIWCESAEQERVQVLDVSPVAPAASLEVGFVEIRGFVEERRTRRTRLQRRTE